jgi:hypothetical protein
MKDSAELNTYHPTDDQRLRDGWRMPMGGSVVKGAVEALTP